MTLEFFAIFVSVCGGVGVAAFIIIAALFCRKNKLLDTDDDSESVYTESASSQSTSYDEELNSPNDNVSNTERSWEAESSPDAQQDSPSAQADEKPRRHRKRRRRSHRHRNRKQSFEEEEEEEEQEATTGES